MPSDPVDCVKGADYILSILDSGPVVREVFFDSGAADAMKRGAVFIDMASIPPKMAQEHAAWLKERGVGHLDAPVSGGSFGAAEGSLAIMAGRRASGFRPYRARRRVEADGPGQLHRPRWQRPDRQARQPDHGRLQHRQRGARPAIRAAPAAPTPPRFRWRWLAAMPTAAYCRSTAGA